MLCDGWRNDNCAKNGLSASSAIRRALSRMRVDATLEHRLAAVPELANRALRVIVSKDEPKRVITAHLDRKMKGKL
jgi:Arc/MetJ-type ribon-helix-helix transcriptional regulator